jgi:hypothetical protein
MAVIPNTDPDEYSRATSVDVVRNHRDSRYRHSIIETDTKRPVLIMTEGEALSVAEHLLLAAGHDNRDRTLSHIARVVNTLAGDG